MAKEHPCANATLWEVNRDKHLTTTRRKDGLCENCLTVLEVLKARAVMAEELDFELI